MARGRGEVSGFTVPAHEHPRPDLRHGAHVLRDRRPADVGAVIFELARSEQTYTFQRPMDYATSDPRGRDRGRLEGSGLHPGRPLPVQRQEVRRGPRGDDRGDPPRVPPRHRRRLPQHRHRQLHAGGPLQAQPRRGAEGELHPCRRAHRAHPAPRGRRRDRQRRRRDRRGRQGRTRPSRSSRPTSTATTARARQARPRRRRACPRSASRPAPATAACRCPAAASPRSSSTSTSSASLGEVARAYGLAGAVQHGASTLPDELFHRFPEVETAEIHLATGFQNALYEHPAFPSSLMDEIYAWCR